VITKLSNFKNIRDYEYILFYELSDINYKSNLLLTESDFNYSNYEIYLEYGLESDMYDFLIDLVYSDILKKLKLTWKLNDNDIIVYYDDKATQYYVGKDIDVKNIKYTILDNMNLNMEIEENPDHDLKVFNI